MKIEEVTASTVNLVDQFVASHPAGLLYYSSKYRRLLERILSCESSYFIATESDKITGLLPTMRLAGAHGTVVNTLPFYGSNGGVLASTPAAGSALLALYESLNSGPDVCCGTWIANPFCADQVKPTIFTFADSRISQCTALSATSAIEEAIDPSARRNVRKAITSNVKVSIENDAVDFLFSVHRINMQEIGGKAKDRSFFDAVATGFAADTDYKIYVARIANQPIAALLLFYFGETVEYFTPVTVGSAREYQPMALILREAMQDAIDLGYRRWNWGGTWESQEGVWRFKKKWGAISTPYHYFTRISDLRLLELRPEELLASYPGFYVLPFHALKPLSGLLS